MSIDLELFEKKIDEIDGRLEEIKALNESVIEFIEDVQNINENNNVILRDNAYRVIYFANMIHSKSKEISKEINSLISCQQITN